MLNFDRGMPTETDRFTILDVARQVAGQMIPLNDNFSFFCTTLIVEEDLKQYVHEPVEALPPAVAGMLPHVGLLLVPFLDKGTARGPAIVSYDRPPGDRSLAAAEVVLGGEVLIALATSDIDMSEYHYTFYDAIAGQLMQRAPASFLQDFDKQLREETEAQAHGEIREESWTLKQKYLNRPTPNGTREAALWKAYAKQSLRDTLTLYLHGICCDIDVEAGPRQLASRHIRKRLELVKSVFPPLEGYSVFPEQVRRRK